MEMNEELNTIEEKDEAVFEEDAELTAEKLSQVTGGAGRDLSYKRCPACRNIVRNPSGLHKCPYCGHVLAARKDYSV